MIKIGHMFGQPIGCSVCLSGDSSAPSANESTHDMMQALTRNLPAYMEAQNAQVLPQAKTQLEASQYLTPAYSKLLDDIYRQYAPSMATTGAEVERINRTGAAKTDLEILTGVGGQMTEAAQALDKKLNPEFYKTREAASGKLGELLGSINLNDPSVEAERQINQENVRSGNLGNNSATNTVANALDFGKERMGRQAMLGQAINAATNFLQPSQGQFNPVNTALNRNSTNTGENRFAGVQNPSSQAYDSANGLMNNISSFQNNAMQINSNRRDSLDRVNETMGAVGSIVSV
jgi:hypothetical protein